jgi:hypothetical protein
MYLQKTNLSCQHVTKASTYITIYYRNGIHALSRCMDSLGHPPFEWSVPLPRMSNMRNAHVCNTWRHTTHNRREDGIRGMDHSINPRNSRDAEQHTYKTRGS